MTGPSPLGRFVRRSVFTDVPPLGRVEQMELRQEQVDAGGVEVTVVAVEGFVDAGTVGELRERL